MEIIFISRQSGFEHDKPFRNCQKYVLEAEVLKQEPTTTPSQFSIRTSK